MTISSRAFRDYATRISFNLSLSRNQVGHLAGIIAERDAYSANPKIGWLRRGEVGDESVEANGGRPNMFIVGRGALLRMGLIEHDPLFDRDQERKKRGNRSEYDGPIYRLTPAGEHVADLLRIAGLIPKRAANTEIRRKKKTA